MSNIITHTRILIIYFDAWRWKHAWWVPKRIRRHVQSYIGMIKLVYIIRRHYMLRTQFKVGCMVWYVYSWHYLFVWHTSHKNVSVKLKSSTYFTVHYDINNYYYVHYCHTSQRKIIFCLFTSQRKIMFCMFTHLIAVSLNIGKKNNIFLHAFSHLHSFNCCCMFVFKSLPGSTLHERIINNEHIQNVLLNPWETIQSPIKQTQ